MIIGGRRGKFSSNPPPQFFGTFLQLTAIALN